jgi:DNA-directed RNA polymerase specialized sigma24 family protein
MDLLLKKLARSYNQTTGLDYEDLFQEANVAYIEALRTYDSNRGALSTHVWWCVSNRLKNYVLAEEKERCRKYGSKLLRIDDVVVNETVSSSAFWERISKDAALIAEVALNRSFLFLKLRRTRTPGHVRRIMKAEGWGTNRINHALYELKMEFSK